MRDMATDELMSSDAAAGASQYLIVAGPGKGEFVNCKCKYKYRADRYLEFYVGE